MEEVVRDKLEVKVLEARDLPTVNGIAPSPYVEICLGPEKKRTNQVHETSSPVWNTSAYTFSTLVSHNMETLLVYVRHKGVFTGVDQVLGVAIVHLSTLYASPTVMIDDWYDLTETSGMDEDAEGSIHLQMTYFNVIDESVLPLPTQVAPLPPNLLEITVIDCTAFPHKPGQSREAICIIEVNDLRKQTRVSKKGINYLTWNELLQIPVSDGNAMLDVTVKQVTNVASYFMGRVRLTMNEVAAYGEAGAIRRCTLYDENLQFDERGNGKIQLHMRWIFDQATEDERIRKLSMGKSFFSRIASLLMSKKPAAKDEKTKAIEDEKAGGAGDGKTSDPAANSDFPPETLDMTPFELDMWMKEQARKRQVEVGELLQIPEEELEIPEGDYMIQVHIIELADIKATNASGLADPIVTVELIGQKQRTRLIKEVSSAFFNETFYFTFKGLKKEQISEAHLKISVYDYNWFRANELIGIYQVDLLSVYNSNDHEMYRRWAAVRNPLDEEDSGTTALLKFSCVCLGPGDSQRIHQEHEDDEEEKDLEHTEGAAPLDGGDGSSQTLQFLVVSILRAEGLPGFDKLLGSSSGLYAFATLEFAGCKPLKTTKVSVLGKKNLSVSFEEELWIPVWVPSLSKRAAITIMNREFGRSDLVVATIYINFDDVAKYEHDPVVAGGVASWVGLSKKTYQGPSFEWFHLYGANPNVRMGPKQAQFMNRFPKYGSSYRGSLLASLRVIKHPTGLENAHKKHMNYEIPEDKLPKTAKYLLKLFVYSGSDFGSKGAHMQGKGGSRYALGVGIGPHELRTQFREYIDGSVDWVEIMEESSLALTANLSMLPDIILTVYKGSAEKHVPVAYCRLKSLTILQNGLNSEATWYEMKHDLSYKSTQTNGYPGCVLLKMSFMNAMDLEEPVDWEPERKKMLTKSPFCLRVFLYQCRNLPPVDDGGLIDAYVKVRFSGTKKKSITRKQSQNPNYYECLEFVHMLPTDLRLAPNIQVQVWDAKPFGNTPVAALRVKASDVSVTKVTMANPPLPQWLEFHGIDGKAKMGEVLVSFQLIQLRDIEQAIPAPKDINPSLRKVWLDIHVVGLRNLVKAGSGIRRPFITFDAASHAYGDLVQTSTSRVPSAANPNFLDRYILQTMLPEDPSLAPALEVKVYDQKMRSKVLLGIATISMRDKLPWNGEEYVPPRKHKILAENIKALKQVAEQKAKASNKKVKFQDPTADDDGNNLDQDGDNKNVNIEDLGLGVFPPEIGFTEPGSKYVELPTITDQEEEKKAKMKEIAAELALMGDMAQLSDASSSKTSSELKKIIGFPTAWASVEYLKGREWWVQSKKKGEGGRLEDYLKTYPFENYDLYRGHIAFNKFGKRKDTTRKVGLLKAVIRVCVKNPRYDEEYAKFSRTIRNVTDCVVRVYILRAQNLTPMDFWGSANPYLKCSLGGKEIKDMKTMNKHTLNPDFYSFFEFNTKLAGPSLLKLAIYDHGMFSGLTTDKLMGETIIDLEDRWFHPKWTACADEKPLENRSLFKDGSYTSQGVLSVWVDILTAQEAARTPPVKVVGPEKLKFEVRIVCWRSLDVPCLDGGFADLFASFFMEGESTKYSTDTHWRCKNGSGSWNWRIKIPIELPIKERERGRLKIQMWERNIITSNEIIGENTVNLYDWFMLCYKRVGQPVFPFQEKRAALKKLNSSRGMFGTSDESDEHAAEEEAAEDELDKLEEEMAKDGDALNDGLGDELDDDGDEEGGDPDDPNKPLIDKKADDKGKSDAKDGKGGGAEGKEGEEEEDDDPLKKKKEKTEDDEEEESDVQKLVKQINMYLGVGDTIADDAEWIPLTYHDRKAGKVRQRGRVAISISIVPEVEIITRPVGHGRDEPNVNPYLPPPFGRMSFSFNPCTLINEICGPKVLCCIICCCCCICCLAMFMFMATYLSGIMSIYDMIKEFTPTDAPTSAPSPTPAPTS